MKYFVIALAVALTFPSCRTNKDYALIFHDPMIYCKTVHELNKVVMGNNFTPVVASRNYTYAAIAGYEVIAAGDPAHYQSLVGQLNGFTFVPGPPPAGKSVDFDFAALMAYCIVGDAVTFPEGSFKTYVSSLDSLAKAHGMPDSTFDDSKAYAASVAKAVLDWSKKDNYLKTRSAPKFTVVDSPGKWVPTPPMYAQAVEPAWNEIRPMVMKAADQFEAPAPLTFNIKDKNSPYYKEVMFIKNSVDSLTPEQKHIADFWDDNPFKLNVSGHVMFSTKKFSPTGHWMSVVGIAAEKAGADYGTTAYAYALTAISYFDAFIECWDVKFKYATARPETVIDRYIDPEWRPYLQTPAFPEYTCGHSTISAAAAEALTHVFGDNFAYTDSTELEFGISNRSFASFRKAAIENNWARFYGGIHFHYSCIVSNEYGRKIGDLVVETLKMKR
jgi:hypothetical protein